ncbi:hypothetical protein BOTNAR_0077g00300 [Botryotinia narcissicola]|uniref:Uncharacterized protein n=1 Tax=Botryotinia narcissicola TaxID=278944 RepID=A0A4Z1IW38_9HELO|nr:hypothetical protein BOTNAR_0077g00300 [Botryotinia narcissicola]
MAEDSKGQGEEPWIPPNLAAVLHGPVPKSQLTPIDRMPPRELSTQQLQSRFAIKPTMEEIRSRLGHSRNPPQPRSLMEPRSIKETRYRSMRSRSPIPPPRVDKFPRPIQEMQPQSSFLNSPLQRRNGMELKSMEDMRPQTKRRFLDLMEPMSVDKVQLTPRSIEELQPQTKRSISSLRPLIIMIWQWYGRIHANSNPNIIKIFRCFRPVLQNLTVRENPSERIPYFAISYKLPPIFYVCKLTFTIAKDLYEKEFQVIPMIKDDKQLTYFNEDRDIIALEDAQVLRDWRYNRQTEAESTGRAHMNLFRPATEKITRRINMKHLVIGGTDRSLIEARQLARFYDCESVMLGVPYLVCSRFFSTEVRSKPDREAISTLRDRLLRFWKEERISPFVREDYRRKPIRPVHLLHPAITNFMTPPPGAKSSITFMNDMKFSYKHARLFEHPWEFVSKE